MTSTSMHDTADAPAKGLSGKQKRRLVDALQVALILIAIFIMLVPIVWIFMAAVS